MGLSISTIYIVVIANFFAIGSVWLYFSHSYRNLTSARYWAASALCASAGGAFSLFRGTGDFGATLLVGNGLLIFSSGLVWMGVRRFYDRPIPWRASVVVTLVHVGLLAVFTLLHDDIRIRIAVYSLGHCIPMLLALRDLRVRSDRRPSPGANLAAAMILLTVLFHAVRSIAAVTQIDGQISMIGLNTFQALCILLTVFTGMMLNFGFVLMAVDRLRDEVAHLAMIDDLTGIANRRNFLMRLSEISLRANRMNEPFALMVVDLDGFKTINDSRGHGAGDECLRIFANVIKNRLRSEDLFARFGGDEFCIVLPATRLSAAALVAHGLIKACRETRVEWRGEALALSVSIGITEWSPSTAHDAHKLIAEADQALYVAKTQGRNRLAIYEEFSADERLRTATDAGYSGLPVVASPSSVNAVGNC